MRRVTELMGDATDSLSGLRREAIGRVEREGHRRLAHPGLTGDVGDARSLAIHPSTTTHPQLSPEDQLATGVTPGYVRLSIGLEHPDDLIADLERAISLA